MIRSLDIFTGLLEEVDAFILSRPDSSLREDLIKAQNLIKNFSSYQDSTYSVIELTAKEAASKIRLRQSNVSDLDFNIEEHEFLYMSDLFVEQYDFVDQAQGFRAVSWHLFMLMTDCAALQIIYSMYTAKGLTPSKRHISKTELERRGYWHACELCQHWC